MLHLSLIHILEDFPKTFREIKDTELVKQMTSEELRGEIYLNIREEQNFYRPLSFNLEDGDLPFACANDSNSYKYGYVTKDEYLSLIHI